MEQHIYHEERHYEGVADPYLQPAWLCVPQIKVESDLGVYRCHASEYSNSVIHSTNSYTTLNQSSHNCHSSNEKGEQLANNSQSDFCDRKISNTILFSSVMYNEQNNVLTSQQSNQESSHRDLNQGEETPRYLSSSQALDGPAINTEDKRSKSPWCVSPQQSEALLTDLPQSSKEQFVYTHQESKEKASVGNMDIEDCESRQAFDLTCRKSPSKDEESSSNDSHTAVNEESASLKLQGTCSPKPHQCKVCGKVLSSPSSYYVHMKLHSGNKPYACTMCEASFCRKPYLEVHMRTHTGERPFECSTCKKRFTQKSSLNTHKRVHTGERPYSCDICQKTFAVKSYVTAHRWSHVSEKPLGCESCGLTFTSKNLFALHMRTHIDQNHECNVCGRTFMKDSYLIRHQNRVHRMTHASYSEAHESRSPSRSPPTVDSTRPSTAS